jgi:hypothetical protein
MLPRYITLSYSDSGVAHHPRHNHRFSRHPHVGSTIINTFSVPEMAHFFFRLWVVRVWEGPKTSSDPAS